MRVEETPDPVARPRGRCSQNCRVICVAVLGALLLVAPLTADEPKTGPFANVPLTSWPYESVHIIAQAGIFTGYPNGTFSGREARTRYEFAVVLQRIIHEVQRGKRDELLLVRRLRPHLTKLIDEFSPELAMLGVDLSILRRNMLTFFSPWRGDAPDLATCLPHIYPGVGSPDDPEYARGYRLAVQEWQRGEVVFYVAPDSRSPRISASTGVLYRTLDTRTDEPGKLALLAGHNAEVKRRLERFGLPASAHPEWVERVLHPERPWQAQPPQARLTTTQREATTSDGGVLLRLEEQRPGEAPILRVTTPERTQELPLPGFDLARDSLEVCWSPTLDLLHLAQRRPGQEHISVRVVELRGGQTLHQVEVPAATLRPATRSSIPKVYPFSDNSQ